MNLAFAARAALLIALGSCTTQTAADQVRVAGNRFVLDDREVVLNGINYFPAYFPALFPDSWLAAGRYQSAIIDQDLATLKSLGVNLVSIQGPRSGTAAAPKDCANLRDFLGRAQKHGLLVNLYIGGGSLVPFAEPSRLAAIPRDCALAGHPALFAYDIAWEPHFGGESKRGALRPRWLSWLEAAYGSLTRADDAFGDGHALPSDREFCAAGTSVRVAALRRFLDDVLSASYRAARAAIHAVDSTHLIGARSGYGGNGAVAHCADAPVDLRAGAKHLDFISPEAYAISKTDKAALLARGGFTSAYADVGKPVFWAEFGVNVDGSCTTCNESVQADFFSGMFDLIRRTSANGGAVWWYVGVRPRSPADTEHSDYGIVRDRPKTGSEFSENLRPAARLLKDALSGVSAARRNYESHVVVDRDSAAGDWSMYAAGSRAYADAARGGALVGVRTSCSGSTSKDAKLCVGNARGGTCPLKCLNAEWNAVQLLDANGAWRSVVDGDEIAVRAGAQVRARLAAGNTGEGKWLAGGDEGSVRFGCNENAGEIGCRQRLAADVETLADAASGEFAISKGVTRRTQVAFQMVSEGIAWFGERTTVTLLPQQ